MSTMGPQDILQVLPHRYPMLLVDRIIECDEKRRIVGIKNLSFNESFFRGHFPENPIMPGVLQLEAMAQVGGILLNKLGDREGKISYFLGIDKAKFRKIIRPGDQMRIEVEIQKIRGGFCRVSGTVHVDGELASHAEMTFGAQDDE